MKLLFFIVFYIFRTNDRIQFIDIMTTFEPKSFLWTWVHTTIYTWPIFLAVDMLTSHVTTYIFSISTKFDMLYICFFLSFLPKNILSHIFNIENHVCNFLFAFFIFIDQHKNVPKAMWQHGSLKKPNFLLFHGNFHTNK